MAAWRRLTHLAARPTPPAAARRGAFHAIEAPIEGFTHVLGDGFGAASAALEGFEGDVANEVEFVADEIQELGGTYGPAVLVLLGSIYACVLLTIILCEAGRCLAGQRALGAVGDDDDFAPPPKPREEAKLLVQAKRPSAVGSVVSALL